MKTKNQLTNDKVYKYINDLIIKKLEAGVIPWRKPWAQSGIANDGISFAWPRSLSTGKPYKGINAFILGMETHTSPYFATFNQINKLGGTLKEGAKTLPVVFWKFTEYEVKDSDGNVVLDKFGLPKINKVPFLRYFKVYNVADVDGLEGKTPDLGIDENFEPLKFNPIKASEAVINPYLKNEKIKVNEGLKCFYTPARDAITMAAKDSFISEANYYGTLIHEIIHSTGHISRLNRPGITEGDINFGDKKYSFEELIAEMGAAYIEAVTGVPQTTLDNSAAYIKSWLKVFKGDTKMVIKAGGAAQKAAEYVLASKPKKAVKPAKKGQAVTLR